MNKVYCIFKNDVCKTYKCCYYCDKKNTCSSACKDDVTVCKYCSDHNKENDVINPLTKAVKQGKEIKTNINIKPKEEKVIAPKQQVVTPVIKENIKTNICKEAVLW